MTVNIRNLIIAALIIAAFYYIATRPLQRGIQIFIEGKPLPIPTHTLAR